MNTHSLNRNLKIALTRRSSEQGFAMPVALGLGLVMSLIGITMIVRSQGDRVTTSAQSATARSLSAAETGIARYQSLINTNRPLAMYPACVTWSSTNPNSCADSGNDRSWGNAVSIPAYSSTCSTASGGSGASVISSQATKDWQDVDPAIPAIGTTPAYPGDPTKGQYRLIDYSYTGTVGIAPGQGTLTVEGRVNQSGSGTTASKDARTSTTRLAVTIPVQKNNRSSPIPGLWVIQNTSATSMGGTTGQKVLGNIVINGCQNNTNLTIANIDTLANGTKSGDVYATKEMDMPVTPPRPFYINATNQTIYTDIPANGTTAFSPTTTTISSSTGIWSNQSNTQTPQHNVQNGTKWYTSLPRRNAAGVILDSKSSDGRYYYRVETLTSSGSEYLLVDPDPTVQVIIFVQGQISLGGSGKINSPGYPQKLQIYGNTYNIPNQTSPTATNTKYGCGTLSLTASPPVCPTLTMSINGGGNISALILAPDAIGGVSGGGGGGTCANVNPPTNDAPSGNFVGAVWIKGYAPASNSNATVICSYGNFTDYVATAAAAQSPWAGIPFISGWQRVEATP